MNSELVKIEFCFPGNRENIKNKEELTDLILKMMKNKGSVEYSGFLSEKLLRENILKHLGGASIDNYSPLSKLQEQKIEKYIERTISKSNNYLPIPTKNYVFVFPYLPTKQEAVFEGVMGFTPYSCVFHLFLSPNSWSPKSLMNTVAHELNHTIFYYYHYKDLGNYSLLDEMIMEGLAENFREQLLEKTSAPWAIALSRGKAFKILNRMDKELLLSKDQSLIKSVMFGDKNYDRWTGYSIGYWLIKELFLERPGLPWERVMKLSAREVLNIVKKGKGQKL
jgi:uncharacterized protein YjaZ